MTRYDPDRHHRRSIRLEGYDYTQAGAYFVTVCTQDRACLFGDVIEGEMRLNDAGRMVTAIWDDIPSRHPSTGTDAFVVMPNHVHGIILVGAPLVGARSVVGARSDVRPTAGTTTPNGATTRVAPTGDPKRPSLGDIVGAFKSITTNEYALGGTSGGWPPFPGRLWQRNFYEHIVRNDRDLDRIRQYIADNPARWAEDPENPGCETM
jgi:REP element-mobilizing transposase RayT